MSKVSKFVKRLEKMNAYAEAATGKGDLHVAPDQEAEPSMRAQRYAVLARAATRALPIHKQVLLGVLGRWGRRYAALRREDPKT